MRVPGTQRKGGAGVPTRRCRLMEDRGKEVSKTAAPFKPASSQEKGVKGGLDQIFRGGQLREAPDIPFKSRNIKRILTEKETGSYLDGSI